MKAPSLRNVWLMAVVATFVTACKSPPVLTDVPSVESDIRANLPIGSSRAKVIAYLDERKIRHTWLEKGDLYPGNPPVFDPAGSPTNPDSPTEEGVIDNAQPNSIIIKVGIVIDFKFDETKSRLVSYSVHEVFTGS